METATITDTELLPPNPIRVETALSRFPVHRLSKHGNIKIELKEKNENGEGRLIWKVSYNSEYGQPGPLAYKLDTLIINRKIEEATRPIPKIVRLGSLKEICRALGIAETGKNTNNIKHSLYQNALAGITAKTLYRQRDGSERTLEAVFTRYSVILTGEKMPDGRKADAVYIIINDVFIQVINGAMTRPLDYDYLRSLPPAPQRFYELLSYQMYAAIKNDRLRAKLLYSEFSRYAPLTRQLDWEHARKQMAKIHAPHRKSGYIAKIDYEQTVDADGIPDWIMLYQPGPKARAEYRAFTKRGGPVMLEVEPFNDGPLPQLPAAESPSPLAAELIDHGITEPIARQLEAEYGEEKIRAQIEILDWHNEKKPGKIAEPAGWLVSAIKTGHAAPKTFVSKADRERQAEAKRQKEQEAAEARRLEREQEARERAERKAIAAYWDSLPKEQQAAHDAAAIAQADAEDLKLIEPGPLKKIGMGIVRDNYTRKLLQAQGKLPPTEA